jgi:rubrerythrin
MQATFETALRGLRMTGASVDTRDLVELIVRHGEEEGALLSTYEQLAASSDNETAAYVIGLILEDERHHHRLLAEVANAAAWARSSGAPDTSTPPLSAGIDGELLAQTKRLLAAEQADYRELRRIRRKLHPFADTTLWGLIIDMMLLDTKKHATMLRFLEKHGNA